MKRKSLKTKMLLPALLLALSALSFQATAQVTIGSGIAPDGDALLDLKENGATTRGLLLPRVKLEATNSPAPLSAFVEGMVVYNTNTTNGAEGVTPGYYDCDGTKWMRLINESERIIYAPSIVVPTDDASYALVDVPDDAAFSRSSSDGGITYTYTIDLYMIYSRQFTTPVMANPAAATSPLPVYAANRLNYYVTYADSDKFTLTALTDDGKLSYTVNTAGDTTAKTFMNIVFKIK